MNVLTKQILEEINLFKSQINNNEDQLLSSSNEDTAKLLGIPENLKQNQKAILCYFLPLKHWIRKDLRLMETCFSQMIGQVVKCKWNTMRKEQVEGPGIGSWLVGISSVISGNTIATNPGLKVIITPGTDNEIELLLAGGETRTFLEQHVFPHFLPVHAIPEIEIDFNKEQDFKYTFEKGARINFQSIISS